MTIIKRINISTLVFSAFILISNNTAAAMKLIINGTSRSLTSNSTKRDMPGDNSQNSVRLVFNNMFCLETAQALAKSTISKHLLLTPLEAEMAISLAKAISASIDLKGKKFTEIIPADDIGKQILRTAKTIIYASIYNNEELYLKIFGEAYSFDDEMNDESTSCCFSRHVPKSSPTEFIQSTINIIGLEIHHSLFGPVVDPTDKEFIKKTTLTLMKNLPIQI